MLNLPSDNPQLIVLPVTLNELETRLRQAGWKERTIHLVMKPPVPKKVRCGNDLYIIVAAK